MLTARSERFSEKEADTIIKGHTIYGLEMRYIEFIDFFMHKVRRLGIDLLIYNRNWDFCTGRTTDLNTIAEYVIDLENLLQEYTEDLVIVWMLQTGNLWYEDNKLSYTCYMRLELKENADTNTP
jgi:hypothetical protein